MKRTTRRGGYLYVYARPLYYSPFGHGLRGYFADFPWIHLPGLEEMLDYCRARRIDALIGAEHRRSAEDYLRERLGVEHLNGLAYQEYRLTEFVECPDVEVVGLRATAKGKTC